MRHFDDDDEEQTRRPGPEKKMDPPIVAAAAESSSSYAAARGSTAATGTSYAAARGSTDDSFAPARGSAPHRKVYRAGGGSVRKPSSPTAFQAEEQSVEPAPAVNTKVAGDKPRRTTATSASQTRPGAQRISGPSSYDDDRDTVFRPSEADEEAEAIPHQGGGRYGDTMPTPSKAESIPYSYAQAEVVKNEIPVAAVVASPEPIGEVDISKPPGKTLDDDEEEQQQPENDQQKRSWLPIAIVLVVVVIAAIIIVAVVAGKGGGGGDNLTEEEYITLIQSRSPSTFFVDSSSPQRLTLDWMLQDATTAELKDDNRILQRFAVGTMNNAFGFSLWGETSTNECDWRGVACNHGGGNIVNWMSYYNQGLDGSIPREIGLLTGLTWLDLSSNNNLEGWLPSEIQKLTHLSSLFLDDTALTGSIPSNLCNENLADAKIDCGEMVCDCCQCM